MKQLAVAFCIFLGCIVAGSAAAPATVTPAQAGTWLAATPGAQVLDVRTKEEFAGGHLANAILIPWTDTDFTDRAAKQLDPRKGGHGGFDGPKLNARLLAFFDKYLRGADATIETGRLKVRE